MLYTPPPPPRSLDPANQPEYEQRLRDGLHQALIDAGSDDPGGACVIRVATAMAELVRVMAFAIHNAPAVQVPSHRRSACEEFAKSLNLTIANMQRAAEAGELPEMIRVDDQAIRWPQ
jgi:hypothetical protein